MFIDDDPAAALADVGDFPCCFFAVFENGDGLKALDAVVLPEVKGFVAFRVVDEDNRVRLGDDRGQGGAEPKNLASRNVADGKVFVGG